ncbi:hypothetical protein J3F83DRAFT_735067 [Trichoderma novae-zelandiae]
MHGERVTAPLDTCSFQAEGARLAFCRLHDSRLCSPPSFPRLSRDHKLPKCTHPGRHWMMGITWRRETEIRETCQTGYPFAR